MNKQIKKIALDIDDVLAMLVEGPKKEGIKAIEAKVNTYFNHNVQALKDLMYRFTTEYKGDRKEFALANRTDDMFGACMQLVKRPRKLEETDYEKEVKDLITKRTNSLGKAKEFLEKMED